MKVVLAKIVLAKSRFRFGEKRFDKVVLASQKSFWPKKFPLCKFVLAKIRFGENPNSFWKVVLSKVVVANVVLAKSFWRNPKNVLAKIVFAKRKTTSVVWSKAKTQNVSSAPVSNVGILVPVLELILAFNAESGHTVRVIK